MLYQKKSQWLLIALLSVTLFALTFLLLGLGVDRIWFREDDLGTILNGIIRSWDDLCAYSLPTAALSLPQ